MGRDRQAGAPRRPGDRAVDPLLAGREPRLVGPDLADDPGPDRRVQAGYREADLDLGHELVGERAHGTTVDVEGRGVVGVAVPAGGHDEVEPGGTRQPDEPAGIAPDA